MLEFLGMLEQRLFVFGDGYPNSCPSIKQTKNLKLLPISTSSEEIPSEKVYIILLKTTKSLNWKCRHCSET